MKEILILAGVLVALAVLRRLVPLLLVRLLGGVVGRAIGSDALAKQPDTIHLHKCEGRPWQDPSAVQPLVTPMLQRGFQDAGIYRATEMPGLLLQLLVKGEESWMAAIYEHPQAGHWLEIASRYQDGSSITFSTSRPTGLAARPGHPVINAPDLGPVELYDRARTERPRRPLTAVTPFTVPRLFERAYAESIAYRKQKGISAGEVANVATRMRDAA